MPKMNKNNTLVDALAEDLLSSLSNPEITDITLIGSDGGRVPAIRSILGARSKVFERMLLGNFRESGELEIKIPYYEASILEDIVRFCCAAKCPTFITEEEAKKAAQKTLEEVKAQELDQKKNDLSRRSAHLYAAADYFELPALARGVVNMLARWFFVEPEYACPALDEAVRLKFAPHSEMIDFLTCELCDKSDRAFGAPALLDQLTAESWEYIFNEKKNLPIGALDLLNALTSVHHKFPMAGSWASNLDLRVIPPLELLKHRSSAILDKGVVLDALASQGEDLKCFVTRCEVAGMNGMYEHRITQKGETITTDYVKHKVCIYEGRERTFIIRREENRSNGDVKCTLGYILDGETSPLVSMHGIYKDAVAAGLSNPAAFGARSGIMASKSSAHVNHGFYNAYADRRSVMLWTEDQAHLLYVHLMPQLKMDFSPY